MGGAVTAPRWISEALDAAAPAGVMGTDADALAAALIERLPIEAMVAGLAAFEGGGWMRPEAYKGVTAIVRMLTDGDPEVVQFTELYQDAAKALDAAGVPYGEDRDGVHVFFELGSRIRSLAAQRPIRLDLQRVEAERDLARQELSIERLALLQVGEARDAVAAWLDRERAEREADRVAAVESADAMAAQIADASLERDKLAADRDYWKALAEARAAAVMPYTGR